MKKAFYLYLLGFIGWFCVGCTTTPSERRTFQLMDQADSLMQSDPWKAHALLDSIVFPDEMNDKNLTRWCQMKIHLSDSIQTPLPYPPQMERMFDYMSSQLTPQEEIQLLILLGRSYLSNWEQEKALKTYSQAFSKSLELKDLDQAGYICSYMADVYQFQDQHSKAVQKYEEAASYFQLAENYRSQGIAFLEASRNYTLADADLDSALFFMQKADSLLLLHGDSSDRAAVFNGLGNIYLEMDHFSPAENYLKQSTEYDPAGAIHDYIALASLYVKKQNLDSARYYTQLADSFSCDKKSITEIPYLYYQIEKGEGNIGKALSKLEEYVDVTHSILKDKQRADINGQENRLTYTNILVDNIQLKDQYYRGLVISGICFLVFIILFILVLLKIKSSRLALTQKENEMYLLKKQLIETEKDLKALQEAHKYQQLLMDEQELRALCQQKEIEIKELQVKIKQRNEETLNSAAITRRILKLSKEVTPNSSKSPLTLKDWQKIRELIDMVYPAIPRLFIQHGLTESEQRICYLTMFHLSSGEEANLLNLTVSSVNKYRQILRKKLQIKDRNVDLEDFLAKKM